MPPKGKGKAKAKAQAANGGVALEDAAAEAEAEPTDTVNGGHMVEVRTAMHTIMKHKVFKNVAQMPPLPKGAGGTQTTPIATTHNVARSMGARPPRAPTIIDAPSLSNC